MSTTITKVTPAVMPKVKSLKADPNAYKPYVGTNGSYIYRSAVESLTERLTRERFWRSLGKKIRKGSR